MKRFRRVLIGAAIAFALALCLPVGAQVVTEDFQCSTDGCPNRSTCNGTLYHRNGCSITCYSVNGSELIELGSASCGKQEEQN
jgi:hypothetical protein